MTWVQIEQKHLLAHEGELLSSIAEKLRSSLSLDQTSKIKSELRDPNSMLIFAMQVAIDRYLEKKNKKSKTYKNYQDDLEDYKKLVEQLILKIENSPLSNRLQEIAEEIKYSDTNQFNSTYYGLQTTLRHLAILAHDPSTRKGRPNSFPLDSFIRKIATNYEQLFDEAFAFDVHGENLLTNGSLFAECWFKYAKNVSQSLGCKDFYTQSSFRTACKRAVSTLKASK